MMRLAHRERPSDAERRLHYAERQARENTRPHGCGVHPLPSTKRGAQQELDAAATTHQELTLMSSTRSEPQWYDDRDTLLAVARHAEDIGMVFGTSEVFGLLEKPWHWQDAYASWRASQAEDEHRERMIGLHLDRVAGL